MSEKFNSLDNRKKGLIYIILYAISIALMNTLLKLAGPIPPTEKIVYKSFICIIGGFIVFGTFPKVTAIIGYVIIIAAAILLVLYNFKVKENTSNQKHTA